MVSGTGRVEGIAPRTARQAVRRQRGTSLIEIMVVLVVLLIGLFMALRIFPAGFGIIRANGNRSLATRLAEQQMSQMRSDVANLPSGVLFTYPDPKNNFIQTPYSGVDPDCLIAFDPTNFDPTDPANKAKLDLDACRASVPASPYFSDVNKFRYIKGEGVKVPLPTASAYGTGSVYTCKFGPILMDVNVGKPDNVPTTDDEKKYYDSFLRVTGAPLTGVNVESGGVGTGAPNGILRSQQVYVIDYGEDKTQAFIAFAPRPPSTPARTNTKRTFSITITYDTGGVLKTDTIPMVVDDAQAGTWLAIPGVSDSIPGSETVVREFDRIKSTDTWDNADPYQYKLRSPNIAVSNATYGNLGVLNFNPNGANYVEAGTVNPKPFTAYLDYAVLDWHILREEREVPSLIPITVNDKGGTPVKLAPIRMTLTNIKHIGDAEADNTFYNGLYNDAKNQVDFQAFNLNDPGAGILTQGDYNGGTPNVNDADYYVDSDEKGGTFKTGTVYVNLDRLPAGSKIRFLYKAVGDWAISLQKAYSHYQAARLSNGNPSAFPLIGKFDGFGLAGVGPTAELRFPLSDLGKSFVVTVQYTLKDGTVKQLAPIQMTTDKDKGNALGDAAYDSKQHDVDYAKVNVYNNLPSGVQAEFAGATGWNVTGAVTGVSIKSRVIYRDTDSTTNRWRVQDMDSYLTPQPTQ